MGSHRFEGLDHRLATLHGDEMEMGVIDAARARVALAGSMLCEDHGMPEGIREFATQGVREPMDPLKHPRVEFAQS